MKTRSEAQLQLEADRVGAVVGRISRDLQRLRSMQAMFGPLTPSRQDGTPYPAPSATKVALMDATLIAASNRFVPDPRLEFTIEGTD